MQFVYWSQDAELPVHRLSSIGWVILSWTDFLLWITLIVLISLMLELKLCRKRDQLASFVSLGYILLLCLCFQCCRSEHFLFSRSQDPWLIAHSYACDLHGRLCRDIARYYRDIAEFLAWTLQRYGRDISDSFCIDIADMQRACRDIFRKFLQKYGREFAECIAQTF